MTFLSFSMHRVNGVLLRNAAYAFIISASIFAKSVRAEESSLRLPPGVQIERDISYIPGGDPAQKLDIYRAKASTNGISPLIVYIHGGGWMGGSKSHCPYVGMVARGYVVASVEYRFSQVATFPAQIQDCQAAIRWLRLNREKYGIDPDHIGVIGGSAGGHLSALLGTTGGKGVFSPIGGNTDQSDRVQAVCDVFGPTDFTTIIQQAADDKDVRNIIEFNTPKDPCSLLLGKHLDRGEASRAASPIFYVEKGDPPFLILHGTHDIVVPYAQSVEFAKVLREKDVPVWLQTLPGANHGGPAFVRPEIRQLVENFFAKFLQNKDVEIQLVQKSKFHEEKAP